MKLAISDKIVRENVNSLKDSSKKIIKLAFSYEPFGTESSSKKLFYQTPKLAFWLFQTVNFDPKNSPPSVQQRLDV